MEEDKTGNLIMKLNGCCFDVIYCHCLDVAVEETMPVFGIFYLTLTLILKVKSSQTAEATKIVLLFVSVVSVVDGTAAFDIWL